MLMPQCEQRLLRKSVSTTPLNSLALSTEHTVTKASLANFDVSSAIVVLQFD